MKALLLAAFAALLALSPCRAAEITGQVFIVTKAGPGVKLPLVHVYAFPEESITQFIAKKREDAQPLRAPIDEICSITKAVYESSETELRTTRDPSRASELVNSGLEYAKATTHRAFLDSAAYLFSGLRDAADESTTDLEGKFSLTVPDGRYVIAARASRLAGEEEEHYAWLVPVSAKAEKTARVALNNETLSSAADSFFKTTSTENESKLARNFNVKSLLTVRAYVDEYAAKITRAKEEKLKERSRNHLRAQAELKLAWQLPATTRFSALGDTDDEFTTCHQTTKGLWESSGVLVLVTNGPRIPWSMLFQDHADGTIHPVYTKLGNRHTGDISFAK